MTVAELRARMSPREFYAWETLYAEEAKERKRQEREAKRRAR